MNTLYSLPLAILLFSACSQKQVETKVAHDIKKTKKIMAIQPQSTPTPLLSHPKSNIISTPIIVKNPQQIQAPVAIQSHTMVSQQTVPQQVIPFNRPIEVEAFEPNDEVEMVQQPLMEEREIPVQTQPYVEEPYIPQEPLQQEMIQPETTQSFQPSSYSASYSGLNGEFRDNYTLKSFIDRMVYEHGFDRNYLNQVFSQAQNSNYDAGLSNSGSPTYRVGGAWDRYRDAFIYERNIQRGIKFWNKHRATLERATAEYGVPAEYIVGIIGIETAYGVNFGKKKVLDVLTTRSMLPNRRNQFYTKQLEKFLIMTRQANLEPTELIGSNAGAMGYGQFIPSSYLEFGVDFNSDGKTDLWDAEDAIGSIANYFARNGWNSSIRQVAVRAKYHGNRFKRLKTGYKTKYSQYKLRKKYKIKPRKKMRYTGPVSLVKLNRATHDELWFGTHNFRVITTYNHSSHYGMAVFQLGEEVKKRRGGYYSSL